MFETVGEGGGNTLPSIFRELLPTWRKGAKGCSEKRFLLQAGPKESKPSELEERSPLVSHGVMSSKDIP